ncbi:unnamed protein product [Arctogadus glacialis]
MAVEENEACGEMGESGMGLKGHRTGVAQGEHRPRKDYKEPRPLQHESTLQAVYLITQPEHGKQPHVLDSKEQKKKKPRVNSLTDEVDRGQLEAASVDDTEKTLLD